MARVIKFSYPILAHLQIVNEKGKTIADLWDGEFLKCTFRRNMSEDLYQSWLEIVELVDTIHLLDEEDEMIWPVYYLGGLFIPISL